MRKVTLKRWVVLCLLSLFAAVGKGETVGVIVTAAGLTNSSGALPDNSLIQVIANTAGQTPGSPTVSAFVTGSDVVLASFPLNSSTTGIAGSFQIYLTVDRSAFAGLNSGAPLLLRWYDIPYAAGQTAPGTAAYGQFTASVIVDDSTSGWTLDLDGNNATLNFVTVSNGGSQPTTSGTTAFTINKTTLTVTADNLSRSYGNANPTLTSTITGFVNGDTLATAVTGQAALTTTASANSPVGSYPIAATVGSLAAPNYNFTFASGSLTILPANVSIAITNLAHTYDGTAKQASTSATPSVPIRIGYPNGPAINAGSYTVTADVTDANYSGSALATLTIARAAQTITLSAPATATLGTASVSATASSGLPVTLAVSGPATLAGSQLTFSAPGTATVTATQAGNGNYLAATATATITFAGKLAQTIAFAAPTDRLSNSDAFPLNATATSGLPVSFAIVGGPAMLSGSTLTLTGTAGRVLIRASQAGNALYDAAPDVTVGFTVTAATLNVFFGALNSSGAPGKVGDVAATLPPNSNQGSLLIVAPGIGVNTVLDFTLNPDGTFTQTVILEAPGSSGSADSPARAAAPVTGTIRGTLVNGRLTGTIEPLNLAFSADVLPVAGLSTNAAGFYKSSTLANTQGATYLVVGTNNEVLVLTQTPGVTTGGLTTLAADGTFAFAANTADGVATIRGLVDEPTASVAGTISLPGKPDTSFAGLIVATIRTDRLVNISSRMRISAADPVLIIGFVIGGTDTKQVLVRGVGPALTGFGVQNAVANPGIRIYRGNELVGENDDWSAAGDADRLAATFSRLGAFALANNSTDAALVLTLPPGAYTAQVSGGAGVALAEIYDAGTNPNSDYQRLVNISTRGEAGTGENILISGFVVTGNAPKKLLVRGIGPGLTAFGVASALADPQLRVFSGVAVLAENDNWSAGTAADTAAFAEAARNTGAFTLAAGSRDAALILTLAPGTYTAQVGAAGGTSTGVALIEIYEIPE